MTSLIEKWKKEGFISSKYQKMSICTGDIVIRFSTIESDLRKAIDDFNIKMEALNQCIKDEQMVYPTDLVSILVEWDSTKREIFGSSKSEEGPSKAVGRARLIMKKK